jgi:hypothetical protein
VRQCQLSERLVAWIELLGKKSAESFELVLGILGERFGAPAVGEWVQQGLFELMLNLAVHEIDLFGRLRRRAALLYPATAGICDRLGRKRRGRCLSVV